MFSMLAIWGLVSGAAFALLTSALGRRGGWSRLSVARVARWGFLGGMVAPFCLGAVVFPQVPVEEFLAPWSVLMVISGILSAVLAALTLLMARRGTKAEGEPSGTAT
jgi:hypothetical protein